MPDEGFEALRDLIWVAQQCFTPIAQESRRQDYLHEVEHMRERVARLEQAIMEAVKLASPALQQVTNDLQALRVIADISAVTIASELGQVSRFESARQLMGYCGVVPSDGIKAGSTRARFYNSSYIQYPERRRAHERFVRGALLLRQHTFYVTTSITTGLDLRRFPGLVYPG